MPPRPSDTEAAPDPWIRRPLPVAVASSVVLAVVLSLVWASSADPPTQAEKDTWADALADSSGHGLRWYLHQYPSGAYADEAESRLASCWTQTVESLGPKRDVSYPLEVGPSTSALPTEDEARKDALARANTGALDACRPLRRTANVLTVTPKPREWHCHTRDGGHVCGFDGESICRAQDRLERDYERCATADGE